MQAFFHNNIKKYLIASPQNKKTGIKPVSTNLIVFVPYLIFTAGLIVEQILIFAINCPLCDSFLHAFTASINTV